MVVTSLFYDEFRSFCCEQCHFTLYINSSSAVAAIIVNNNGDILLTKRAFEPAKGKLDLPGGFVDPMESAEEALIREIKEELNLTITKFRYLTSFPNEYVFKQYSVYTTDLAFICEVESLDTIEFHDDVSGYQFINPKQIDYNTISSQSIKNIIQFYLKTELLINH